MQWQMLRPFERNVIFRSVLSTVSDSLHLLFMSLGSDHERSSQLLFMVHQKPASWRHMSFHLSFQWDFSKSEGAEAGEASSHPSQLPRFWASSISGDGAGCPAELGTRPSASPTSLAHQSPRHGKRSKPPSRWSYVQCLHWSGDDAETSFADEIRYPVQQPSKKNHHPAVDWDVLSTVEHMWSVSSRNKPGDIRRSSCEAILRPDMVLAAHRASKRQNAGFDGSILGFHRKNIKKSQECSRWTSMFPVICAQIFVLQSWHVVEMHWRDLEDYL